MRPVENGVVPNRWHITADQPSTTEDDPIVAAFLLEVNRKVYAYARKRGVDTEDAADVAGDTLVVMIKMCTRSAPPFANRRKLFAFVYRVADNLIANIQRVSIPTESLDHVRFDDEGNEVGEAHQIAARDGADTPLIIKEMEAIEANIIAQLPP